MGWALGANGESNPAKEMCVYRYMAKRTSEEEREASWARTQAKAKSSAVAPY